MLFKEGFTPPLARSNHIRRDKGSGIINTAMVINCLSLIENKRYWLSLNESLGYNHPDIPKDGYYQPGDILAARGAIIADSIPSNRHLFDNINIISTPSNDGDDGVNTTNNSIDFFASQTPSTLNDSYDAYPDFYADDDSDMYYDCQEYNLIEDVSNHSIEPGHKSINIHIDADDIRSHKNPFIL